jgi:hypothetical protein
MRASKLGFYRAGTREARAMADGLGDTPSARRAGISAFNAAIGACSAAGI